MVCKTVLYDHFLIRLIFGVRSALRSSDFSWDSLSGNVQKLCFVAVAERDTAAGVPKAFGNSLPSLTFLASAPRSYTILGFYVS
jgi:hypothetical protein